MPKLSVYDLSGAQTGEIELNDSVFGAEFNEAVVHQAVVMQLANQRQGTSATKTRAMVRGGGRKPWKQKVLAALVAVPTVLPYGLAVVPLLVPNPAAMQRKCLVKHVA